MVLYQVGGLYNRIESSRGLVSLWDIVWPQRRVLTCIKTSNLELGKGNLFLKKSSKQFSRLQPQPLPPLSPNQPEGEYKVLNSYIILFTMLISREKTCYAVTKQK